MGLTMAAKLLINGEAGTGKTQLLSTLDPKTTFVVARDNKTFPVALPHMLVTEYYSMDIFLYGGTVRVDGEDVVIEGVVNKFEAFNDKFGHYPETVVFDTVSQITMDVIAKSTQTPDSYGSQGKEVTKELSTFTQFLHEYLEVNGINIILLSHVIKDASDDKAKDYVQFGQGAFKNKGGFYADVNEAITLAIEGSYLVVYTKGQNKVARSRMDVPPKMYIESTELPLKSKNLKDGEEYFTLNTHLQMIIDSTNEVEEFRL